MSDETGSVFDDIEDDTMEIFGASAADRENQEAAASSSPPPSDPEAPEPQPVPGAPPVEPEPAQEIPDPAEADPEPVAAKPTEPAPAPVATDPAAVSTPAPAAPAAVASPPAPTQEEIQAEAKRQSEYWAQQYALSADEAEAVVTDLPTVLPSLAARLHQSIREDVRRQVLGELPQLIARVTDGRMRETEARTQFYSRWPQLSEHSDAVLRTGQLFRAANPNASAAEATEAIGKIVCMSLGLQVGGGQQPAPAATVQRQAPFRPAGASGVPNPHPPVPSDNPWAQMADELAADNTM